MIRCYTVSIFSKNIKQDIKKNLVIISRKVSLKLVIIISKDKKMKALL